MPTAEVLRGWSSVADARAWAGLDESVSREFLGLLGNRELSNLPLASAVDPMMVRRTILEVRVPVAADAAASEGAVPPPRGV